MEKSNTNKIGYWLRKLLGLTDLSREVEDLRLMSEDIILRLKHMNTVQKPEPDVEEETVTSKEPYETTRVRGAGQIMDTIFKNYREITK